MRLFVAIEISKEVAERITEIEKRLFKGGFDLKFVEPENLHLTLKFLGEVSDEDLKYVESVISYVANEFQAFNVSFQGLGYFGSERNVKVLWIGVKEGKSEFVRIASSLDKKLSKIREEERKEKTPHLTIARVKSGKNRENLLREIYSLNDVKIGEVYVKEIKLKKSELTPKGPVYSDLKAFPLKEKSDKGG